MRFHVLSAIRGGFKGFLAVRAHVGPKVAVGGHVASQAAVGGEGGVTQKALIRLQARVCPYVSLQHARGCKTLAALDTLIRPLARMGPAETHTNTHAHTTGHLHLGLLAEMLSSYFRAH